MTKISRNIITAVALGMLVAGATGCKKEGPMEKAGKEIDKAAEKTGDKIDRAVEKSGEKLEKAGEKIKDSVR